MNTNHRLTAIALAVSLALLQGCGGGGGSGGSTNVRPTPIDNGDPIGQPPIVNPDPTPDPAPDPTPDPVISPSGERTTVAIIDSEFRLTHEEFEDQVVFFQNFANADGSDPDNSGYTDGTLTAIPHGTGVASAVAGNTVGINPHAQLALLRIGVNFSGINTHSFNRAMQGIPNDARVLSLSFARNNETVIGGASGNFTDDWGAAIDNRAAVMPSEHNPNGLAVVAAGGNGGVRYMIPREDGTIRWINPETGELWDVLNRWLVVGMLNGGQDNWNDPTYTLSNSSNFPGEIEEVQARWLVGPSTVTRGAGTASDTHLRTNWGTSYAAPQVAGMLAGMFSEWPHLTAEQATARFLETGDRSSPLYEDYTCGATGDVNCGLFYFGQGRADYGAAMAPDGDLMVPAGTTVDGPAVRLDTSYAQWSSGFGGALDDAELSLAALDNLDRDYTVDLDGRSFSTRGHGVRTGRRIEALAQNRAAVIGQTEILAPGLALHSQMTADGQMGGSRVSLELGRYQIGMFGFADGFTDAINPWTGNGGLGMIADTQSGWLDGLDSGYGFEVSLPMRERTTLSAQYWEASADTSGLDGTRAYRQSRWDAQMAFAATDRLTLNIGSGYVTESDGILGSRGFGALALDGGLDLHSVHLGAQFNLDEKVRLMARLEQGRGDSRDHSGALRSVRGITTEQAQVGLNVQGDTHQGHLLLSRPLRVTSGSATFDLPVGRTLDGEVLRETRQVDLATEGRQIDLELGYAFTPSANRRIQANVLYSRDPDHRSGSDAAGSVVISQRF